jgi:hypothetical protein
MLEKKMTHAIQEDDGNRYSFKEQYKKVAIPPEKSLLEQLRAHYNYMINFTDEKHEHKKNVLLVAMDVLMGKGIFDDLLKAITDNPLYNQAIFPSETKNLVDRSIKLAPENSKSSAINKDQKQLIVDLQTHLNSISSKHDEKHQEKQVVIIIALDVMNGKASVRDLEVAMKDNPRYGEAFFTSKTETLISQALELANKPADQPTLK